MKDTKIKPEDVVFEMECQPTIKQQILKCFTKNKYLVVPQLIDFLEVSPASIKSELNRMVHAKILKSERKMVKLPNHHQSRTITVYYLAKPKNHSKNFVI